MRRCSQLDLEILRVHGLEEGGVDEYADLARGFMDACIDEPLLMDVVRKYGSPLKAALVVIGVSEACADELNELMWSSVRELLEEGEDSGFEEG